MSDEHSCVNCRRELALINGVWLCRNCNSPETEQLQTILGDNLEDDEWIFIKCPGATLYDPESGAIIQGVKFNDDDDPFQGHKIIGEPVYAPTHTKRRRIKRDALGHIRRCQGCQDYTIRMRRREGRDFFIPSLKHPGRTKLKSVIHRAIE
jgi:hypothetical protein